MSWNALLYFVSIYMCFFSHREDLAVARSPSGDQLPSPPQARFPSPAQGRTGRGTAQDTGPRPPSDPAVRKVQTYNLPR